MKSILDQSHRTVLANLEPLQRAQQCVTEITEFLWDALREVADELPIIHDPALRFALDKGGWIQATTFPNWQVTTFELISVGIENFALSNLIGAEHGQGSRAYIYSILLNDPKRVKDHQALASSLRKLQPPEGFVSAPIHEDGYLFVKELGAIPIESFCARRQLKSYFSTPLIELTDWVVANAATITALGNLP